MFYLHSVPLFFRLGRLLPGICRPRVKKNKKSSEMNFREIRKHWGYRRNGHYVRRARIPTLKEWMQKFAKRDELKLMWLDVKVTGQSNLAVFVRNLAEILKDHQVTSERQRISTLC